MREQLITRCAVMILLGLFGFSACQKKQNISGNDFNTVMMKAENTMQEVRQEYRGLEAQPTWELKDPRFSNERVALTRLYDRVKIQYMALRSAAIAKYGDEKVAFDSAVKEFRTSRRSYLNGPKAVKDKF